MCSKLDEIGRAVLPQDIVPMGHKAVLKFLFKENLK
jgi:hypothetical protein